MIGDNAFVGSGVCANCGITIEDGQCNENITGSICNCPGSHLIEPSIIIQVEELMRISPMIRIYQSSGMVILITPLVSYYTKP